MSHLKRQRVPKRWPIPRKGTAYVVNPNFSPKRGLPILVILRDILGFAQNRKEVKKAIHSKQILLNNKFVKDDKSTVLLFDIISITPMKKQYRLELSDKGKFKIQEIKGDEANQKVSKIINKKILKGKITQLNLDDGRNFLSDLKCNVNDSVLTDLKNRKIERCLPLKEKSKAIVFIGKHAGEKGIIDKIDKKIRRVELNINGKTINILIKQLMVIE